MDERDLTPEQKLKLDKIRSDFDGDMRDLAKQYERQRLDRSRACNKALHDFWVDAMQAEESAESEE